MNTLRVPVDPWNPDPAVLREAAAVLRRGGLVAFPTETVYGLGANALNADAVRGIYRAKGRPSDNPLILHLGELKYIQLLWDRNNTEPGGFTLYQQSKHYIETAYIMAEGRAHLAR